MSERNYITPVPELIEEVEAAIGDYSEWDKRTGWKVVATVQDLAARFYTSNKALAEAEARLAEALQHRAVLLAILRDGIANAPCPTPAQWREVQDMSRQLLAAADSASAAPSGCNWREHNDFDFGSTWVAECGLEWCFEEEPLPSKHGMAFCPKCGKTLIEHPYVEPDICGECGEEMVDGRCPEGCTPETVSADRGAPK